MKEILNKIVKKTEILVEEPTCCSVDNGTFINIGTDEGNIHRYDTKTGELILSFQGSAGGEIQAIAANDDTFHYIQDGKVFDMESRDYPVAGYCTDIGVDANSGVGYVTTEEGNTLLYNNFFALWLETVPGDLACINEKGLLETVVVDEEVRYTFNQIGDLINIDHTTPFTIKIAANKFHLNKKGQLNINNKLEFICVKLLSTLGKNKYAVATKGNKVHNQDGKSISWRDEGDITILQLMADGSVIVGFQNGKLVRLIGNGEVIWATCLPHEVYTVYSLSDDVWVKES